MASLFFLIALVFSIPFSFSAESNDTDWKPFESFTHHDEGTPTDPLPRGAVHSWFTQDQIRRANDYFLTLNDTQKFDLFGNDIGGKRFSPVKIYIQLSKAFHKM